MVMCFMDIKSIYSNYIVQIKDVKFIGCEKMRSICQYVVIINLCVLE